MDQAGRDDAGTQARIKVTEMNAVTTGPSSILAAAIVTLCCFFALAAPVRGQSVHNLERGLPLEVQDTAPTDTGKISLQASAINETSEMQDRLTVEPSIQWGFAENAHLQLSAPFYIADTDAGESGSGDVYVGLMWNFLAEGQRTPSVAILAEAVAPSGIGSSGFDTQLTLIATKQITKEQSEDRLHFNVQWYHNADPADAERENRLEYVIGYSRKLNDKAVLVLDYFHRQEQQSGQESNMMEIGFLYQLSQRTTVGAGIGTGIGQESPDMRMGLNFQIVLGS